MEDVNNNMVMVDEAMIMDDNNQNDNTDDNDRRRRRRRDRRDDDSDDHYYHQWVDHQRRSRRRPIYVYLDGTTSTTARIGDLLEIVIPVNYTAGYSLFNGRYTRNLQYLGSRRQIGGSQMGASSVQIFYFRITGGRRSGGRFSITRGQRHDGNTWQRLQLNIAILN